MKITKNKVIEYCIYTFVIHMFMWAVLTPWFFLALQFTWEQYVTWIWQAPIVSLAINYPLGKIIERVYKTKIMQRCRNE